MGVSSTTNRVVYVGNGVSTAFAFPFYFFAQTNMVVYVYDTLLGGVTLKVLNTDYTIAGSVNAQGLYPNGGVMNFITAPLSTDIVVVFRDTPEVQNYALLQNGQINSTALVQQLDYLTLEMQRVKDLAVRAVGLPDGMGATFNPALPADAALNPDATIVVNLTGDGLTFGPTATQITTAIAAAQAAAAAAAASAAAANASALSAAASAATATAEAAIATAAAALLAVPFQQVPTGLVNGANTTFTLAFTPGVNGALELYQDGLILVQGVDYTIVGATITMTAAPLFGQTLYATYVVSLNTAGVSAINGLTGLITLLAGTNITLTAVGNVITFDVPNAVNTLNGLFGAVTLTAGANITLTPVGNNITIAATGGGGGSALVVDGSRATPQLITAAGGLLFAGAQDFTKKYIAGSPGAVIVTANPQIAAGASDGQELTIQSTSAVNTVELQDGNGLAMNGAWIGGLNSSITFTWDTVNWVEKGRA